MSNIGKSYPRRILEGIAEGLVPMLVAAIKNALSTGHLNVWGAFLTGAIVGVIYEVILEIGIRGYRKYLQKSIGYAWRLVRVLSVTVACWFIAEGINGYVGTRILDSNTIAFAAGIVSLLYEIGLEFISDK